MDYLKFGKNHKHFVHTPKLPEGKEIKKWGNNIVPLIEKKLESLAIWGNYLDRQHEARLRKYEKLPQDSKWFWLEYADAQYRERYFVSKWQRYWLEVLEMANGLYSLQGLANAIGHKLDLEKAKAYPLEHLYNGQLRESYGKLVGLCPFHQEKTPSFYIYPDNKYHCYGCGEHGDSIDFAMQAKHIDFKEAYKWLVM